MSFADDPPPPGPSKVGYAIAAVVAVAGLVLGGTGAFLGFRSLADRVDAFQRVGVPGEETVSFDAPGDFTVYYEGDGSVGDNGVTVSLPPVRVSLERVDSGEAVELDDYSGEFTYTFGGHDGRAIATFHIDEPGTYVVSSDADVVPGVAELAVGKGVAGGFAVTILSVLFIGLAQLVAGVLVLVTWLRRRNARRQAPSAVAPAVS